MMEEKIGVCPCSFSCCFLYVVHSFFDVSSFLCSLMFVLSCVLVFILDSSRKPHQR